MVRGERRKFSTGETTIVAARRKATAIMADVKSRGLDGAIQLHGRRNDRRSADPDIEEFADIYREAMSRCETPPTKPSVEYYIRSLEIICLHAGISRLSHLNRTRIDHFVKIYQQKALAEGRQPEEREDEHQLLASQRGCDVLQTRARRIRPAWHAARKPVQGSQTASSQNQGLFTPPAGNPRSNLEGVRFVEGW